MTDPINIDDVVARFPASQRDLIRELCTRDGGNLRDYYAKVVPQPIVVAATEGDLPRKIERKCCQYKSCGNTDLMLEAHPRFEHVEADQYRRVPFFHYVRESNGDVFWAGSLNEIVERLNDPTWYPVADGD